MIVTMVAALLSGMLVGRVFARPSRRVASAKSASARHAPFYVGGNPEAYEREARALAGVAEDNPYWRAVKLVGAAVQNAILHAAMNAPTNEDRLRLLAEARGAGRLLEELAAKRAAKV